MPSQLTQSVYYRDKYVINTGFNKLKQDLTSINQTGSDLSGSKKEETDRQTSPLYSSKICRFLKNKIISDQLGLLLLDSRKRYLGLRDIRNIENLTQPFTMVSLHCF